MVPLSEEQQRAHDEIVDFIENGNREFYVMHGLAGTGKTTVLSRIGTAFGLPMCAFTGKAASVLHGKTGLMASTIHSYIYNPRNAQGGVQFDDKYDAGELFGEVMLLDECSMVNHAIARDMLRTGMRIIACGDPGQLPPVVGEQYFCVPDFTLAEVHRQALESPIIRQAHAVRAGQHYQADGDGFQMLQSMPRERLLEADAVICYTNATRRNLTIMIREMRGYGKRYPQAGEPVMCLRNSPDYGIFNGGVYDLAAPFEPGALEIHLIVDGGTLVVPFVEFECIPSTVRLHVDEPTTRFDFGYVLTCHKSQGSEWNHVVIVDEYPIWRQDRARWVYTAITRASEKVTIIPCY